MRLFLLDLGNSRLNGGIFFADKISSKFAISSKSGLLIKDYKNWFQKILQDENLTPDLISGVILSSVVPQDSPILLQACHEFFTKASRVSAILELKPTKTPIKLLCDNPLEVGADRVANMLGAHKFFRTNQNKNQNILIFDCGTATTAELLTPEGEFIGGLIAPGLKTGLDGLIFKASQLADLQIPLIKPKPLKILGTHTVDNIQAGIYYSGLGLMKEVIAQLKKNSALFVIGTGGFSSLFKEEQIFDIHEPDLILWGLVAFWLINKGEGGSHGDGRTE